MISNNQFINTFCPDIVNVWSQYDGSNIEQWTIGNGCRQNQEAKLKIEQWTIGFGCRQNQEAKLKIVGGEIPQSNQQENDPTSSYITSVIISWPLVLYWPVNKQVSLKPFTNL